MQLAVSMKVLAVIAALTFGNFLLLTEAGLTEPVGDPNPLPDGCTIPCMDAVFVLDVSISIQTEENFQLMKDFVTSTLSLLNISAECSHAAVILFASDAWIRFDLNEHTDLDSVTYAINNITYFGISKKRRTGTNTPSALDLLRTAGQSSMLGLRDGFVHIAMFLTDGRPNLKHIDSDIGLSEANQRTEVAGNRLHDADIYDQIYAIGIEGNKPLGKTLNFIADPESLVFPIAGFDGDLFTQLGIDIAEQFCDPCVSQPCPTGSECRVCNATGEAYCVYSCAIDNGGCGEGKQCLQMDVPTCNPDQCCSPVNITCSASDLGMVDCVFVLDVSLSIESDTNFRLMQNMIKQLANQLPIGVNNSLFSVILFARHAWIYFTISDYTNRVDLINAVDDLSYYDLSKFNRSGSNIPEALDFLTNASRDGTLGLRSNTSYTFAFFITDGSTNTINLEKTRLGRKLTRDEKMELRERNAQNFMLATERLHNSEIFDDIFAIGIRNNNRDLKFNELDSIVNQPQFKFEIDSFTDDGFQGVAQQLSEEIFDVCSNYECPSGSICRVCSETGMIYCEYSCSIDNGGCSEYTTCIETPVACPPDQCCSPVNVTCQVCELKTDFVFVLDVSISIGSDENFEVITDFVSSIGVVLDIGLKDNLVGVILFARHATIHFHAQEHTNEDELTAAITSIVYSDIPRLNRTGTNMPEALDLLRTAGQSGGELRFRDDPTVAKVAVFITDGRPNTKHLTGNTRKEDAQNTQDAAARLHESGIYDQVYAIGIRGKRIINFRELNFIASDPSLVVIIQDFDAELFQGLEGNLTNAVCGQQLCTVEGQVYTECAPSPDCRPTCKDPNVVCPAACVPGCICPQGTMIDEVRNRCVPLSQCTCPPQCSDEFCNSNAARNSDGLIPCMRGPPPYTEADCMDDCQLTYCQACYHSNTTLSTPPGCVSHTVNEKVCNGCLCCLREWTRCVEVRNMRDNECTEDCQTADNFKCYDYPPCI